MLTCHKCNTINDLDAKFCKECGTKIEVESKSEIDTQLSSLQQSAPKGLQEKMAVARSQVRGERRPVTILFTDIVGSTLQLKMSAVLYWKPLKGIVEGWISRMMPPWLR